MPRRLDNNASQPVGVSMSINSILASMFRYKIWADDLLFIGLDEFKLRSTEGDFDTAVRLIDHGRIVSRIFLAHLEGSEHYYETTEPDAAPELRELESSVSDTNNRYLEYVNNVSAAMLEEEIRFHFTDGSTGRMSREEMLCHVLLHSGYHRGEVGRIMTQVMGRSPRDTFTGFLHEVQKGRRN